MSFYSPVNLASIPLPITLTGSAANPAGTVRYIGTNGTTTDLVFNVLTAGTLVAKVAGTNQIFITSAGIISGSGIVSSPARRIESLDTAAAQHRLTYTAASVFKDFTVDANGCVTIGATGGITTGILKIGTIAGGGTYPLQVHSGTGNVSAYFVGSVRFMATSGGYYDISSAAASGEFLAGGLATSGTNLAIKPGNSVGNTFQVIYYNGSAYASALEIASAAAAGILKLMRSGGDVNVGGAAIATNATSGFLRIPTCAGTPTGVPANAVTGLTELVVDSSNNKLYAYYGAAWHDLTGA